MLTGNYYFYQLNDNTRCSHIHGFFSFYDDQGDMTGFGVFYEGSEVLWETETHPHPLYRFWNVQEVKVIT